MEDALRAILADIFDADAAAIDAAFSRENAEFWDSLNHLRMVTALEEHFGVSFSIAEIEAMKDYASILASLERHTTPQ